MSIRTRAAAVAVALVTTLGATAADALAHGGRGPDGRAHDRYHRHAVCARQLDRSLAAYLDTTARHDAAGFEALMADEYTVILPGGTVFAGKPAASGFIDGFFARTDWTQTFKETEKAVKGCRTALVVFDSTYTDEDGAQPLVIGLTWTYEHGRWYVLQDQNTVVDPS